MYDINNPTRRFRDLETQAGIGYEIFSSVMFVALLNFLVHLSCLTSIAKLSPTVNLLPGHFLLANSSERSVFACSLSRLLTLMR